MSLSQSTALSLSRQKSLILESEHHLQKISSHDLTITDKTIDSGKKEKFSLNNKESP